MVHKNQAAINLRAGTETEPTRTKLEVNNEVRILSRGKYKSRSQGRIIKINQIALSNGQRTN